MFKGKDGDRDMMWFLTFFVYSGVSLPFSFYYNSIKTSIGLSYKRTTIIPPLRTEGVDSTSPTDRYTKLQCILDRYLQVGSESVKESGCSKMEVL